MILVIGLLIGVLFVLVLGLIAVWHGQKEQIARLQAAGVARDARIFRLERVVAHLEARSPATSGARTMALHVDPERPH